MSRERIKSVFRSLGYREPGMPLLCLIFGHRYRMFDENWCGVDYLKCRCGRVKRRLIAAYEPSQFDFLPYDMRHLVAEQRSRGK